MIANWWDIFVVMNTLKIFIPKIMFEIHIIISLTIDKSMNMNLENKVKLFSEWQFDLPWMKAGVLIIY